MKPECAAPAPATQRVNREEIRMLVQDVGYQETEARTGIAANTLYQWARRFGWSQPVVHSQAVRTVRQSPADAHSDILAEHERETRLSLARSARKLATEAESAKLNESNHILNVAKTAGIVHKWGDEKQNVSFSLNVLNLNMLSDDETHSPGA